VRKTDGEYCGAGLKKSRWPADEAMERKKFFMPVMVVRFLAGMGMAQTGG